MSFSDKLEIARKIVIVLGPLFIAIWTVYMYFTTQKVERTAQQTRFDESLTEQKKELATLEWEARRPFLERQMALCFEAAATASTLATTADNAKWDKANGRFWELYWGELALVENRAVANKMVEFGITLKAVGPTLRVGAEQGMVAKQEVDANQAADPKQPASANEESIEKLRQASLQIAYKCRALIGESWKVELPQTSRILRP